MRHEFWVVSRSPCAGTDRRRWRAQFPGRHSRTSGRHPLSPLPPPPPCCFGVERAHLPVTQTARATLFRKSPSLTSPEPLRFCPAPKLPFTLDEGDTLAQSSATDTPGLHGASHVTSASETAGDWTWDWPGPADDGMSSGDKQPSEESPAHQTQSADRLPQSGSSSPLPEVTAAAKLPPAPQAEALARTPPVVAAASPLAPMPRVRVDEVKDFQKTHRRARSFSDPDPMAAAVAAQRAKEARAANATPLFSGEAPAAYQDSWHGGTVPRHTYTPRSSKSTVSPLTLEVGEIVCLRSAAFRVCTLGGRRKRRLTPVLPSVQRCGDRKRARRKNSSRPLPAP